nr:MAG TPA: YopX protein [Caudoviricetes sp.]
MQDRYLFRGKRIDNGEWVIGNRIDDGVTGQVFIHTVGNSVNESDKVGEEGCLQFVAFEVAPATICQCTGWKDKNGKLIWENDIVKDDKGNFYKAFWQEKYYQFSWVCVKSEKLPVGAKWNLNCFKGYEMEIISNVFDNQELLEE